MTGAVADRSKFSLQDDMEVMWNIVKRAQDKGDIITKKMLGTECQYIKPKEWDRFNKAYDTLIEQGRLKEITVEVGKGFLGRMKKETALEAIEPSMKKDIEHMRHGGLEDEG